MRETNFFSFGVVFGFFAGLLIAIGISNDILSIIPITFVITFFFYLLSHISVALFLRFTEFNQIHFEKESYERKLDYFFDQIKKREVEVDSNYEFIKSIEESATNSEKSE
jgi:hypothetical protein